MDHETLEQFEAYVMFLEKQIAKLEATTHPDALVKMRLELVNAKASREHCKALIAKRIQDEMLFTGVDPPLESPPVSRPSTIYMDQQAWDDILAWSKEEKET